jgi:hypothetical protein
MSAKEEHTTLTRDAGIVGFFALGSQLFGLESSPSSLNPRDEPREGGANSSGNAHLRRRNR